MARGRANERTLVDIEVELEPHLQQQPALDESWRHIGRADSAEQNGIEATKLFEHSIGQDLAVAQVASATEIEIGGLEVYSGGADDLERLNGDFWANAVATNNCKPMLLVRIRHKASIVGDQMPHTHLGPYR